MCAHNGRYNAEVHRRRRTSTEHHHKMEGGPAPERGGGRATGGCVIVCACVRASLAVCDISRARRCGMGTSGRGGSSGLVPLTPLLIGTRTCCALCVRRDGVAAGRLADDDELRVSRHRSVASRMPHELGIWARGAGGGLRAPLGVFCRVCEVSVGAHAARVRRESE